VQAYWVFPPDPTAKCISEGKSTLAAGIINCFADLLVTMLPMPVVMRLKMPPQQRLAVVSLFSVGLIVTVAGIVRTYFIWKSLLQSYDETWFAYPLWIAAAVEIDLGVVSPHGLPIQYITRNEPTNANRSLSQICASAPALRPLVSSLSAKLSSKGSTATPYSASKGLSRTLSKGYKPFPKEIPSTLVITRTQEFELKDWTDDPERAGTVNDAEHKTKTVRHEDSHEWPLVV
jgi:hypothetical protein